jgi:hypothetical protein
MADRTEKKGLVESQLRKQYDWQKVKAPKTWYPKLPGEELIGYYGGRTLKNGRFGQYEVVVIHVPMKGAFLLTGTMLIQLLDAACCSPGDVVRIVWQGRKPLDGDREMKLYELYTAEEGTSVEVREDA